MKVEILQTLKLGDGTILEKGIILDGVPDSLPRDVMYEINHGTDRVKVLNVPAKPVPAPASPPVLIKRGKK